MIATQFKGAIRLKIFYSDDEKIFEKQRIFIETFGVLTILKYTFQSTGLHTKDTKRLERGLISLLTE